MSTTTKLYLGDVFMVAQARCGLCQRIIQFGAQDLAAAQSKLAFPMGWHLDDDYGWVCGACRQTLKHEAVR